MKSLIGSFIGLVLSVSVDAEPLLEGRVRLSSGQPATDATITSDDTQISADVVSLETSNIVAKSLSLTAPEEVGHLLLRGLRPECLRRAQPR